MSRRLVAAVLGLLLLVTQQWGTLHVLAHALHGPDAVAHAGSGTGLSDAPSTADAGDALCQVCLVLAALGAASLPALWRWLGQRSAAAAPQVPRPAPAPRRAPAPWLARGPPALR
jgi:hypothetical protein